VTVSKPEAEEQPDRVHVPRLRDRLADPAQEQVEEAALVQLLVERGLVEVPASHPPEDLEDADQ
jgi:hypothetical protein